MEFENHRYALYIFLLIFKCFYLTSNTRRPCLTMDYSCRTFMIKIYYSFQNLTNNIPSDISFSFYLIYINIYSWCISIISINSCAIIKGFCVFLALNLDLNWKWSTSWNIQTNKLLPPISAQCLPTTKIFQRFMMLKIKQKAFRGSTQSRLMKLCQIM